MSNLAQKSVPQQTGQTGGTDAETSEFEEILYHITHDVRASFRALKGIPQWIREELEAGGAPLSDSVLELFEMMHAQADRADRMMLDLRTYSRIGRLHEQVQSVTLAPTIQRAANSVHMPPGFDVHADLAVPAVLGAPDEIELLFRALLSNAVKHHDDDHGAIRIHTTRASDGICIAIADDGPGIPTEFRERVFQPMTTLKPRDDCEGSGMGLPIARKIVAHLGGTIEITEPGAPRGTRVEISLPTTAATVSAVS